MPHFRTAAFTSAFALTLSLSPAHAVTPEEVWSDWRELIETAYGATLEFSRADRSGQTLTISDLTVGSEIDLGDEIGRATLELLIDQLAFENVGNGVVRIDMTRSIPVTMIIPENPETDRGGSVSMTMSFADETLRASGTGGDIRYDFAYPVFSLNQFEIDADETDDLDDPLAMTLDLAMSGLEGFATLTGSDIRAYETGATLDAVTMDFGFESDGGFTARFNATDLAQTGAGTIGKLSPAAAMSDLVASGTTQIGTTTYGPATYEVLMDMPQGGLEIAAAAEGGSISSSLTAEGLVYDSTTANVTMSVTGSMIPFPQASFSVAELSSLVSMPVVPGPDTQDFGLKLGFTDLVVDDTLWSLFDPMGALPRDPATLNIDLSGSGILSADVTDPEYPASPEDLPPGELSSLTINDITLSLAGAELTGVGDFSFSTEDGMPVPEGEATIGLTGAIGLMNTLVEMGLLPQEQAMGAQMMMGLFAEPVGDDALRSTIQVTEDGQVLANGQRIR